MLPKSMLQARAAGLVNCLLDAGAEFCVGHDAADGFDGGCGFATIALNHRDEEVNSSGEPGLRDGAE